MNVYAILAIILLIAAVFFPAIFVHARRIDQLQAAYLAYLRSNHPEIAIGKKMGIVQYIEIDGVSYPSSIVDFYKDYRRNPERMSLIIDIYIVSVPARFSKKVDQNFDKDFVRAVKDAVNHAKKFGPKAAGYQFLGHGVYLLFTSSEEVSEARKEKLPFIQKTVHDFLLQSGYAVSKVQKASIELATVDEARDYNLFR